MRGALCGAVTEAYGRVAAAVLDGGDRFGTRSVIGASGVAWRELEVVGADSMVGRGIYYGAARTEALNTRGRDIFLIGGGNSAGQAAMFFANYAHTVTLVVRGASLVFSMSHYLIGQLETKPHSNIEGMSQVVGRQGRHRLRGTGGGERAPGGIDHATVNDRRVWDLWAVNLVPLRGHPAADIGLVVDPPVPNRG